MSCKKKNATGKLFALMLLVTFSLVLMLAINVSAEETPATASTVDELITHINNGAESIQITADFEIDKPIYITTKVTIYADTPHTLTRNPGYSGDLFVVGTDAENRNPVLDFKKSALILGKADADSSTTMLTIDGNTDNMTVDVCGTAIYATNGGIIDFYGDVKITNSVKTNNERVTALDSALFSYPEYVGGGAVIIANGAFNMHGGIIENSGSRTTNEESISLYGGAIFNNGTFNMYGGTIRNCSAFRGGAIYNYRIVRILSGMLDGNYAGYGGAIAMSGSQVTEMYIGNSIDEDATTYGVQFINNHSFKGGGGAIISSSNSPIIIYGDTLFDNNVSEAHSGGAIYTSGTLTIYNSTFTNNTADYYGGAIYHFYAGNPDADDVLTVRQMQVRDTVFDSNIALRGGAAAFGASYDNAPGAQATFTYCTFTNNTANAVINETPVLDDEGNPTYDEDGNPIVTTSISYGQGGALFVSAKSTVTVSGSTLTSNHAGNIGGAVAATGASTFKVSGSTFNKNSARSNGGAINIYTGSTFTSSSGVYKNNTSENGYGGALYFSDSIGTFTNNLTLTSNTAESGGAIYMTGSTTTIPKATITGNTAENLGGAIFVRTGSMTLKNATLKTNEAYRGAGVYLGTSGAIDMTTVSFTSNSVTNRGGAMYVDTNGAVTADDCHFTTNTSADAGGAILTSDTGTLKFTNSTFGSNTGSRGGAIFFGSGENVKLELTNTDFTENTALTGDGGALFLGSRLATRNIILTDCAFTSNTAAAGYGGAAFVYTDTFAEFNNTAITSNSAKYGGGVYVSEGAADFTTGTIFTSNTSTQSAGALYIMGSTVKTNGVTFDSNHADYRGGAIFVGTNGILTADNTTFTTNTATDSGGAILTSKSGAVTLSNSSFKGNEGLQGGAVFFGSGDNVSFAATNTDFTLNKATGGNGGALYLSSGKATKDIILTECEINENTCTGSGGAMYISGSSYAELNNLTAMDNTAKYGGIMYVTSANTKLDINGITFSGNTAKTGPDIYSANASIVITVDEDALTNLESSTSTWTDIIKGKYSVINYI